MSIKYFKFAETNRSLKQGFTLAEIVVTIALLGVVSVFAIPKILSVYEDGSKKVVFLETLNVLDNIMTEGLATGKFTTNNSTNYYYQYFVQNANATRTCRTNSKTERCWDETLQGYNDEIDEPGFVLASGAMAVGFEDDAGSNGVLIDWNGTAGPNKIGDDWLWVNICLAAAGCIFSGVDQVQGTIEPIWDIPQLTAAEFAANKQLYDFVVSE